MACIRPSQALKNRIISYPILTDNNYSIWHAFGNQFWPALYIVDAKGNIRHHQFGEGGYEQSEKVIQQLLTEAGSKGINQQMVSVEAKEAEVAADWGNLKSQEIYVGYETTEHFSSPGGVKKNKLHLYKVPTQLELTIQAMAQDAIAFIKALGFKKVNLLGFSMGGFVAQQITLTELGLVNKIILAGTGPKAADGFRDITKPLKKSASMNPDEQKLFLFYSSTLTGRSLGRESLARISKRNVNRDPDIGCKTMLTLLNT
ncbi:MAG: alpha/beta fold hydrolase [Chitinophagaceae bacterium]